MGGKSGGGARTPTIKKNTLHGANRSKHVDLISSGEIFGFEHGNDELLKSIYLNDTPIQNQDGSLNFSGVRVEYNRGAEDQDYLPSFTSIDRNIDVGAQVKKNVPVTRSVTNSQVTSVRATVGVDALMRTTKEGDQLATSVSMSIMLMKDNQIYTSKIMTLNEKGSKPFRLDFEFNDLPAAPFEIRCIRNTEDSNDDMLRNNTYFFNYVESIDAKMSYPLSSVVGIEIDAEQFGNNSTTRTYGVKGAIVQVPSNYDPVKRTYSGLWDRLFKPAYTNNPAWVFHDLLTNEVDGFGSKFKGFKVDIDTLYQLSKYCDELVDDGKGGKEPRFVCNAVIMGDDAYKVLYDVCSIFRGVPSYNGQLATTYYDRRSDITAIYTNSNVEDGLFNYNQVERDKQYNQIQVQYVDKDNGYESTIVEVSDDDHIAKNGINSLSTVAFGQTKESYALRSGAWTLVTSLTETETVSFTVGDQGIKHEVYDIIQVADNDYIGTTLGARIKSADGTKITLDRELNQALKFSIETIDGPQNFTVKRQISANEYELDKAPLIVDMAQCTAILEDVAPRLFRCLSIEEGDDRKYTITAIQHNSQKENIVDKGAEYVPGNSTIINPIPELSNGIADNDGRAIILRWDSLTVIGTNNTYRIQLFKDKALYQTFETKETFLKLENLPQGEYIAKIRAINDKGQHSGELTIAFSTTYKIDGLRAKGVVFGIQLNWQLPALITSDAFTEIWYSTENDRMTATKLAVVTYPQSQYLFSGLSVGDEFFFWFRLVDSAGNQGEFGYSILGKPSDNANDILGYLEGKITSKELDPAVAGEILENAKEEIDAIVKESEVIKEVSKQSENSANSLKLLSLARATADNSLSAQNLLLNARTDKNEANIKLGILVNTTADRSRSEQYVMLNAKTEQTEANLENFKSVVADQNEAISTSIETLKSEVGENLSAEITDIKQTIADVDGNVKAMATLDLKTTSNGKTVVGGYRAGVDGESSNFNILADNFKIIANADTPEEYTPFLVTQGKVGINGDMIVSGTISGDKIQANTVIKSPRIEGGEMFLGNGRFEVNKQGQVKIRADATKNVGLQITNERIDVYDENGTLRVRMGRLN